MSEFLLKTWTKCSVPQEVNEAISYESQALSKWNYTAKLNVTILFLVDGRKDLVSIFICSPFFSTPTWDRVEVVEVRMPSAEEALWDEDGIEDRRHEGTLSYRKWSLSFTFPDIFFLLFNYKPRIKIIVQWEKGLFFNLYTMEVRVLQGSFYFNTVSLI